VTAQLAQLETRTGGPVVVASIAGEIDMSNAADLGSAAVASLTAESAALLLDLTRVSYLDSAAIHMIYELRERLAGRGLKLAIAVPPDAPTVAALRLTGVPASVPTFATVEAAEAELGP
jgi:anti-sigma B factor antagonist